MTIDINTLSYEELLELKHMISRRLKYLESTAGNTKALPFQPGDTVSFSHPREGRLIGTLIKYNERTATILTNSGQQWDVSANLLRQGRGNFPKNTGKAKIIDISSRQS